MAKHETRELLLASPLRITTVANHIRNVFVKENFDVKVKFLENGECDIIMSENKVIADPYTLHITMKPHGDSYIDFYARNDTNAVNWIMLVIFLIIPLTWPLLIIFIIKMVRWGRQNSLDDRALMVAKDALK